jgi:hypothetical protein
MLCVVWIWPCVAVLMGVRTVWGGLGGLLVSRVGLFCVVLCPSGCFVRCVAGARRMHGVVSCCIVW